MLRREGLLAPQRAHRRRSKRLHDGKIITDAPTGGGAPTAPWPGPSRTAGYGSSTWSTTTPARRVSLRGSTSRRSGTGSLPCNRSTTPSSTATAHWPPTSPAASRSATTRTTSTAPPTSPARSAGSASTTPRPTPESPTNGCAERWIKTLKEQCLWARTYRNVDDLRQAVADFVELYNTQWLIERLGHRTPRETHQHWLADKAAVA